MKPNPETLLKDLSIPMELELKMRGNILVPASNIVSKSASQMPGPQKADLRQSLLKSISKIENRSPQLSDPIEASRVSTGIHHIDKALDPVSAKGILTNALHEIRVANGLDAASGAGFAFCLGLMMTNKATVLKSMGKPVLPPVFWISDSYTRQEYGSYYGPGLRTFDIAPEDLIRICPSSLEESLWAAGEIAAASGGARFCLMEIRGHPKALDLTVTRRLMLRAQSSGTTILILRQSGEEEASSAATRWHVMPASSRKNPPEAGPLMHQFIGPPSFAVSLEKCRGGNPTSKPFTLKWNSNDQCFALSKSDTNHTARVRSENGESVDNRVRRAVSAIA